jgi:hypothetical protein
VVANNGSTATTSRYVTLALTYGTDTAKVLVSNYSDFHDAAAVVPTAVTPGMTWDLCHDYSLLTQPAACANGLKNLYVKFYSSSNAASEAVSTSITLNAAGTPAAPVTTPSGSTPPAGAVYVSSPTMLIGHSEADLWRDPLSHAIYLLPSGSGLITPIPTPTIPTPPAGQLTPEQIKAEIIAQCPAPIASQLLACPAYMTGTIRLGAANDAAQVRLLQQFLITYEGFKQLVVNGTFGQADFAAVKVFQTRYASAILGPIGLVQPTGVVAQMTRAKVNNLYCLYTEQARLNTAQQQAKTQCVTAPVTPPYLLKYIWPGVANDPVEVRKLQDFLISYEGFAALKTTGIYGAQTQLCVEEFQEKYRDEILGPWSIQREGTGNVYKTTQKKINELYPLYTSGKLAPVPPALAGHTKAEPAGVAPTCPALLTKTAAAGLRTDAAEVRKLQTFLSTVMGYAEIVVNGTYNQLTINGVHAFQDTYPVGIMATDHTVDASGVVDEPTLKKINEFNCRYAAGWRP